MATDEIQQLLQTAIQTAQSGNKFIARSMLDQVIGLDPDNEMAWLWKASVVEDANERRTCLERVLSINPNNARAQQALARLQRATSVPEPPPTAPAVSRTPDPQRTMRTPSTAPPRQRTARPERAAQLERDAVLRSHARRTQRGRGVDPVIFIIVGLLAVAMIGLGLFLLWYELQEDNSTPEPTGVAVATASTRTPAYRTPTPIGGTPRTLVPAQPLPATWTPQPTGTATVTPTASVTPIPLDNFVLLVSYKPPASVNWELLTINANGESQRSITLRPPRDADYELVNAFDAAFSHDGEQIAFTGLVREERTNDDGDAETVEYQDLFLVAASGGEIRRLTTLEAAQVESASWSHKDNQIAFASDKDGDYEIYLANVDDGTAYPITRNEDDDRYPAWSPDGTIIAFASDRGGPGFMEVWRMSPTGSEIKRLTENVNSSYAPAWSPDSTQIVFLSDRRVNTDLYIMDADGSGERTLLVRDIEAEERDPAWSPDGRWIAFSSNRAGAMELFLLRPDGTDLRQLTAAGGDMRYADWLLQE